MRWMCSVYKSRHTNFLFKVYFAFLELLLCYLWILLSLNHFCPLWVNKSYCFLCPIRSSVSVTFLSFFSPVGRDILLSLRGVLCFTHTDYTCSVSAFYFYVQLNGKKKKRKWKKWNKKKKKKNQEKSQIKKTTCFPADLFSVLLMLKVLLPFSYVQ